MEWSGAGAQSQIMSPSGEASAGEASSPRTCRSRADTTRDVVVDRETEPGFMSIGLRTESRSTSDHPAVGAGDGRNGRSRVKTSVEVKHGDVDETPKGGKRLSPGRR